jgi:gamma-glutamylcyclotransferase (GGCT)/AIG2-like uncharacterized protein YtfP
MPNCALLFVYGTLKRRSGGELHPLFAGRAEFVGAATVAGRLYLLDGYPGALLDEAGRSLVQGELYRLHDPAAAFPDLDAYEEADTAEGTAGEYRRRVVAVTLKDGRRTEAWMYLYNRPVTEATRIVAGEFILD